MDSPRNSAKALVYEFWNRASCGEALYLAGRDRSGYEAQAKARYHLEPYILEFARFDETQGMRVLEIGVGLGADHQRFAEAGADLYGIDLTERAVEHARERLAAYGLFSNITVGDAENLQFPDEHFELVYSWGVLHHTPETPKAISEIWRVLRPGGMARIMLYHKWSFVGFMLWLRYGMLSLRPWLTLTRIYDSYLESPGTKAYSAVQARQLFSAFREVRIRTVLTHGDLLESAVGQRHRGLLLAMGRKIWPRWIIKRVFHQLGLFLLIEVEK